MTDSSSNTEAADTAEEVKDAEEAQTEADDSVTEVAPIALKQSRNTAEAVKDAEDSANRGRRPGDRSTRRYR